MFTGIIEEKGEVVAIERTGGGALLSVRGPLVTSDARHGDSIAVNGVCLTVVTAERDVFTVDVIRESLDRSSLGTLTEGSAVNLERSVRADQRLGGHIVQGHVDGTATLLSREPGESWDDVRFSLPRPLARYVAEKGSIAIDGISLTVTTVDDESFGVSLIPTTLKLTTLGDRQVGDVVNIEVDVIAKYVERLVARQ
ncbi:riboflavin synthase [Nonomuraea sp. KC401]|uniref:Riboflavin synthase n=1 Tax=Nonomuraea longispora TaxID=1848320 RepID=A0A4R4NKA5_9ACTN|nr:MULTISPECIES: riboflavin synthase [Nonomuraea]NBE99523.1 riboflavin synthase [Nonomuraea sp. K271]TDC09569.1 riboflavin synthase [Nonomuraea longispora]TLF57127.1 riboflavin synthase [Nonomuraea sp. KC401]